MARQPLTTRRTALGTLATLVTGLGFAGATGATRDDTENPDTTASDHASSAGSDLSAIDIDDHLPATPYETYIGTVDRIVDGRHVVILLEEGGQTVDQLVVERDRLPNVAERDHLLVLVNEGEFVAGWPLPNRVVRAIRAHR